MNLLLSPKNKSVMKLLILFTLAISLFLSACGNSTEHAHDHGDHPDGTHTHEDGTVHSDHDESGSKQEEFVVQPDSIAQDSVK